MFTPIVYDSNGNRIIFSIEKAVDVISGKDVLLYPGAAKLGRDHDTIMFQNESMAFDRKYLLTLNKLAPVQISDRQSVRNRHFTSEILISGCSQRISIVSPPALTGMVDSVGLFAIGRVVGCKIDGDWWVRAYPMFGTESSIAAVEGSIQPDGNFRIRGFMLGQRAIVFVGMGKHALKVLSADLHEETFNDLGTLEMGATCPSSSSQ